MQQLLESELHKLNFVVHSAASVLEAKRVVETFDPDVVLIDIDLKGGLNGMHLGHMLLKSHPGIAQVFLTKHDEARWTATDGLKLPSGAGFLSKHQIKGTDELIAEINRVVADAKGEFLESRENLDVLQDIGPHARRVLELVSKGFSNQYIAKKLGITVKTVDYHNDLIYRALGIERSADRNARVEVALRYQRALFMNEIDEGDDEPAET